MSTSLRVVHASHELWLPLAGTPIWKVKRALRDVFTLSYFASAWIDGVEVTTDHVIHRSARVLEFVHIAGYKGGRNKDKHDQLAEGLVCAYHKDFETIGEHVKAQALDAAASVDMALRLVEQWCRTTFGPIRDMDLEQVTQTWNRLAQLVTVSATMQGVTPIGRPGRKNTTTDIAQFAFLRREEGITYKDIFVEWKKTHPGDNRVKSSEGIREACRRYRKKRRSEYAPQARPVK
jgi:hypothetical protein